MIRRQSDASLYLLNKSLAGTAILMITLSYVLSAVHRLWGAPNRILLYRRYTGLVGYAYAVIHIVATLFTPDPEHVSAFKFPFPHYFTDRPLAFITAFVGFVLFSHAFLISLNPAAHNGTPARARAWRRQLRYGYVGVLLIFVHLALLKFDGWVKWFSTFSPTLPPLSLIVAILVAGMVVLKVVQLKNENRLFGKRSLTSNAPVEKMGA